MDLRILVPGEPDVTELPRLSRLEQGGVRAFLVEDAVRILEAQDLVVLHEIDPVGLQPAERFIELAPGFGRGSAVDLRHEEPLLAVALPKHLAHAALALAAVVVPAVVEERDPAVDRLSYQAEAERFRYGLERQVPPTKADCRNALARPAEPPVDHPVRVVSVGHAKL